MRTTLNIDDDVLQAAKELARRQGVTIGKLMSTLARRGPIKGFGDQPTLMRNGVPILPARVELMTLESLQGIMDSEAV